MRILLTIFLFTLSNVKCIAQSELYVLNRELPLPNLSTCNDVYGYDEGNRIFLNYEYEYSQGRFSNNVSSPLLIKITCLSRYDSCPSGTNCGGSLCCQEDVSGIPLNKNLSLFGEVNLNEGNIVSCNKFAQGQPELNYYAVLLPKISSPIDKICEKEELFAQHSDGVNHNVSGLIWEFYSNTGWKEIPNHKNRFPLNVSLLDVFGNEWRSQFSGNLQLRFKYTAPFTTDVIYSFSTYTIELTSCSPEFSDLYPFKTKCNYTEDGSFKLKLKRRLDPNEKLIMTLYYQYSTGFDLASTPQETSSNLFNEPDGTYRHTWNENLPSGNYKIKYQTKIGSGGIAPTDPTWSTLSEYNFTIPNAKRVEFSAEKLNDESCFELEDGKIRVFNVTSEANRTFSYIVYEVQGTNTLTVLRNWTSFSSNSVIVDNLKKARLQVKLRDSQGCFAKLN